MKAPNFNNTEINDLESFNSERSSDELEQALYTGRFLVTLDNSLNDSKVLSQVIGNKAGMRIASINDYDTMQFSEESLDDADALVFDDLGVALVGPDDDQLKSLESNQEGILIEPEQIHYVPNPIVMPMAQATFGLQLTNVNGNNGLSGAGVKLAVLDTGMDLNHPDFQNRSIKTNSFVPGQTVQDGNGHGTHCIGTSCGNTDQNGTRYGIAKSAEIYACKVLSDEGKGTQSWIISGMDWAIKNDCHIISMSLGSRVFPGQSYSRAYERVAKQALQHNTLVVAASGNASRRDRGIINPVGSPANCPSIMAVGAIDAHLNVANFSTRSINPDGQVDMTAPGVNIFSSWPLPLKYKTISGTSMATPHVAGIAALYREKYPNMSAQELWWALSLDARRMLQLSADVGVGLVQAP